MADTKISALTEGSPLAASDALVIVRAGANQKVTLASAPALVGATQTFTATNTFNNRIAAGAGVLVPNEGNGYQAYMADGVTPFILIKAKSGNSDVVIDPAGISTFVQFGNSGVAHGGPNLFIRNGAGLWAESFDYSQDIPLIATDASNNLLIGNATTAGSSQENDLYLQVQAGKTIRLSTGGTDRMTLTATSFDVFGGSSGNGLTVSLADGAVKAQGSLQSNGAVLGLGAGLSSGFQRIASGIVQPITDGVAGGWVQNTNGEAALAANFTKANATLGSTNLSRTVVAGRSYRLTGYLIVSNSVAGEGVQFDFAGGAATATTFDAAVSAVGTNAAGTVVSAALATVLNYTSVTGTNRVFVHGYLKVNAGGTLILRAAENTTGGGGTMTLAAGSWLALDDTVNL